MVEAMLKGLPGMRGMSIQAGEEWSRFTIDTEPEVDLRADVAKFVVDNGWDLRELREERMTLEDLFVQITRTDEAGAPATPKAEA